MSYQSFIMTKNDLSVEPATPGPTSIEPLHQSPDIPPDQQISGVQDKLEYRMFVADLIVTPTLEPTASTSVTVDPDGASKPIKNTQIPKVMAEIPKSSKLVILHSRRV